MDSLLSELLSEIEASNNQYDINLIKKAYEVALACHKDQKRESGEPYITHPVAVAKILVKEYGLDTESIAAALLHDVIEDCAMQLADLRREFGPGVASLVDGVTKLGRIPYSSKEEEQVENLRKMLLAMTKDIRVILIKLADRLHNMRTLDSLPLKKQREKALETMDIFSPLAHRLGMQKMKWELEDISLRYLDPVGYKEIEDNLREKYEERTAFLEQIKKRISERLEHAGYKAHVEGRVKHVYSIYRKMYGQNKTLDEIYDLYAVRIIVDTINDCYNVLGVIHDLFKPIPGRFKDYISTPKPNMYQSLHTTVIGKEGVPFEVQIRTWDMHRTAEYGIAAHWKYKQGITGKDSLDGKLEWVKRLVEIQENSGSDDFIGAFKIDLFADEVFVFTPKGDVVNLPLGATVIDFAYAIHSGVGNSMVGAKVDGKIVQLDYKLETGKIVEIITSSASKGPSLDWLKIARTSEAKNKIRQWFKKEKREENVRNGRESLEREIKRLGINLPAARVEEILLGYAKKQGMKTIDDLYAAIGYGGVMVSKLIPRLREEAAKLAKAEEAALGLPISVQSKPAKSSGGVIVEGIDNCPVKFAKCCNPLPGDDIVGYITRGFGVSVHKRDCYNVKSNLMKEGEAGRWILVRWDDNMLTAFRAAVDVVVANRTGVLADITAVLANMRVPINSFNGRDTKDGNAVIHLIIEVKDIGHLESVILNISRVQDVIKVSRG